MQKSSNLNIVGTPVLTGNTAPSKSVSKSNRSEDVRGIDIRFKYGYYARFDKK